MPEPGNTRERLAAKLTGSTMAGRLAGKLGAETIPEDAPATPLTMKQRLAQRLNANKAPPANSFAARLAAKMNSQRFNSIENRRNTIRPGSSEATSLSKRSPVPLSLLSKTC
eukprot:TRINITY_DN29861_c0_g1_i1.p1 TRINITY_DN29861_c0_g1~~TRINITY_DN29861_c0_g1_i1.p1  ORF type:complete len:112 (-),score=13.85 TRINITY_DN29861_c0_g1_i1:69-404(-)